MLLDEAIRRLLRILSGGRGCLLILEDLHWADADTLAIVEYLVDNLSAEPILLLATIRCGEAGDVPARARAMAARCTCQVLELARLDQDSVRAKASVCLDMDTCPEHLLNMLDSSAEGLPFLVEELLAEWGNPERWSSGVRGRL